MRSGPLPDLASCSRKKAPSRLIIDIYLLSHSGIDRSIDSSPQTSRSSRQESNQEAGSQRWVQPYSKAFCRLFFYNYSIRCLYSSNWLRKVLFILYNYASNHHREKESCSAQRATPPTVIRSSWIRLGRAGGFPCADHHPIASPSRIGSPLRKVATICRTHVWDVLVCAPVRCVL